jgi:hypothetical protein
MMEPMRRTPRRTPVRTLALLAAFGLLAAACTGSDGPQPSPTESAPSFNAEVASADLFVDSPQRFLIGLLAGDADGIRYLSYGDVDLRFAYLGDGTSTPVAGPTATATYVGAPGTGTDGTTPTLTQPSEARGVYQAEDVTFDQAGTWQVTARADVSGVGSAEVTAAFPVATAPALPAPGQRALKTKNLTIDSTDDPPGAIDSRAATGGAIPDQNLHRWTIADAIQQHRPALVVFATPVYCTSKFCGPVVDAVEKLSQRYADRADFIHIEIYHDFEKNEINQAAADWLFRNDDLKEPWLYLIGADGKIVDRWGVLWNPDEVAAELRKLPVTGVPQTG